MIMYRGSQNRKKAKVSPVKSLRTRNFLCRCISWRQELVLFKQVLDDVLGVPLFILQTFLHIATLHTIININGRRKQVNTWISRKYKISWDFVSQTSWQKGSGGSTIMEPFSGKLSRSEFGSNNLTLKTTAQGNGIISPNTQMTSTTFRAFMFDMCEVRPREWWMARYLKWIRISIDN